MMTVEKRQNDSSTYQWLKVPDEKGHLVVYETDDVSELETKVEEMLNDEYSKSDFVIVQPVDYTIDMTIN